MSIATREDVKSILHAGLKRHDEERKAKHEAEQEAKQREADAQLMHACEIGDSEAVLKCLEAGASGAARRDNGWTALQYCAWRGHSDIASALIRAGADIDAESEVRFILV